MARRYRFPVIIERDPESGLYVAIVPGLPGADTQAASLDELEQNVREVVDLCLEEAEQDGTTEFPTFFGLHEIEIER